jgi:hypothetical protein
MQATVAADRRGASRYLQYLPLRHDGTNGNGGAASVVGAT